MSNNITDKMVKDFLGQLSQPWMKNEWLDKWEEFKSANTVEKRDWEIVSFGRVDESYETWVRYPNSDRFRSIGNGDELSVKSGWLEEDLLGENDPPTSRNTHSVKNGQIRIHSVRRLSDNSVWQIGDEIMFCGKPEKIKEFKILFDGTLMAAKVGDYLDALQMSSWQKPAPKEGRKPVCYTHNDDLNKYEGDEVWSIWPQTLTLYSTKPSILGKELDNIGRQLLHFSTLEAANEYINLNRKNYSLNDIKSVLKGNSSPDWILQKTLRYLQEGLILKGGNK
jgi:hypothetical protein